MADIPARPAPTELQPRLQPGLPTGPQLAPGLAGHRQDARLSGIAIAAVAATVVWLGLAALTLLVLAPAQGDGAAGFVVTLVAVTVPVVLIWMAAAAARSARILRHETRRLQTLVEHLSQTWTTDRQERGLAAQGVTVERKLAETAQIAGQTTAQMAARTATQSAAQSAAQTQPHQPGFVTTRDTRGRAGGPRNTARAAGDDQPSLALGTSADELAPPLMTADLIRALNFPETEKDEAGFAALRRALRDRHARQLVQASQDVLTLLSQDGIYMDDLTPDRAHPDIWRRFAHGERGRAVAALGGVRDRSCLALTMGRMRQDTIFRDAAHHFLRLFDRTLVGFEPGASDEDIAHLSETRTARAFMLFGRVTGAFD